MSSLEKNLYKTVNVQTTETKQEVITPQAYRGLSTVNTESDSFVLYDLSLIKQDLLNHFHIRQGEKLENPEFGCIIWDALFEPLTEQLKEAIAQNVTTIVNYDPRTQADKVVVDSFESGLQIDCTITYLPYNISESLRLRFDEENALL
jgi:phage baseplate assembly protein W